MRALGEQAYILHQNAIIMQRFEYALLVTHAALEPVSTSAGTWNLLRYPEKEICKQADCTAWLAVLVSGITSSPDRLHLEFSHRLSPPPRRQNEDQIVEGGILIEFFGQYCLYLANRVLEPLAAHGRR